MVGWTFLSVICCTTDRNVHPTLCRETWARVLILVRISYDWGSDFRLNVAVVPVEPDDHNRFAQEKLQLTLQELEAERATVSALGMV